MGLGTFKSASFQLVLASEGQISICVNIPKIDEDRGGGTWLNQLKISYR